MIESSILFHEGISPSSIAAQDMAKRWWETILSFTNGDTELIRQLSELDIETQLTRNDKDMMNSVSQFLEDSLEIYTIQNNVQKEEDNDDTPDEFNKKI